MYLDVIIVPEQPMPAPHNIHARLRSVARTRPTPVHVRGAGQHCAGAAQRVPADSRRAADPRSDRLLAAQRQGKAE